jgi:hypothetical protein
VGYTSVICAFESFCEAAGFPAARLRGSGRQASDLVLAFLMGERLRRQPPLRAKTLQGKASAINFFFGCRGEAKPDHHGQVTRLLRAWALADGGGGGRAKLPLSLAALGQAVGRVAADGSEKGRVLGALLVLGFFFCCRVGEIVEDDKGAAGAHLLRRGHAALLTSEGRRLRLSAAPAALAAVAGAELFFPSSKADRFRLGARRAHWRLPGAAEPLCPVAAAIRLLTGGPTGAAAAGATEDTPLCAYGAGYRLRRRDVVAAVKAGAAAGGGQVMDFSAHSLRRGGATALRQAAGSTDAEVARLGRWAMPGAFRGYGLQALAASKGQAARMLASGA